MLFSYLENVSDSFWTLRFLNNQNFELCAMAGKTGTEELIFWSGAWGWINSNKVLSLIQEANCSDFIINYEEWLFNSTEMTRISATIDATLSDLGEELSSCDFLLEKMITLSIWMMISQKFLATPLYLFVNVSIL